MENWDICFILNNCLAFTVACQQSHQAISYLTKVSINADFPLTFFHYVPAFVLILAIPCPPITQYHKVRVKMCVCVCVHVTKHAASIYQSNQTADCNYRACCRSMYPYIPLNIILNSTCREVALIWKSSSPRCKSVIKPGVIVVHRPCFTTRLKDSPSTTHTEHEITFPPLHTDRRYEIIAVFT